MNRRGTLTFAGLFLVPVGLLLEVADAEIAGIVCLAGGWLLILAGLAITAYRARTRGATSRRRRGRGSFIVATALAGAAIAAEEPLAGVALSYLAVLWFCVRFWHMIDG